MYYKITATKVLSIRSAKGLVDDGFFYDLKTAYDFLKMKGSLHLKDLDQVYHFINEIGAENLKTEEIQESEFGTLEDEKHCLAQIWFNGLSKKEQDYVSVLGKRMFGPPQASACCP